MSCLGLLRRFREGWDNDLGAAPPYISSHWLPHLAWQGSLLNILWGLVLIGAFAVVVRACGLNAPLLTCAGILGWCLFGLSAALLQGLTNSVVSIARFAISGAVFLGWPRTLHCGHKARGRRPLRCSAIMDRQPRNAYQRAFI